MCSTTTDKCLTSCPCEKIPPWVIESGCSEWYTSENSPSLNLGLQVVTSCMLSPILSANNRMNLLVLNFNHLNWIFSEEFYYTFWWVSTLFRLLRVWFRISFSVHASCFLDKHCLHNKSWLFCHVRWNLYTNQKCIWAWWYHKQYKLKTNSSTSCFQRPTS